MSWTKDESLWKPSKRVLLFALFFCLGCCKGPHGLLNRLGPRISSSRLSAASCPGRATGRCRSGAHAEGKGPRARAEGRALLGIPRATRRFGQDCKQRRLGKCPTSLAFVTLVFVCQRWMMFKKFLSAGKEPQTASTCGICCHVWEVGLG